MHKYLNIQVFIKYAKYDSSINKNHLNLLESDKRKDDLTDWMKDVL